MVDPTGRVQARMHRERVEGLVRDGIEITVIDDRDSVGWFAAATRIDEIYMTSVDNMVSRVIARAGRFKIARLNILDHGNPNGVQIGSNWITIGNVKQYEPKLRKLRNHFHSRGFVHLQHCEAGRNHALLGEFSRIFGVPVYAGTGAHNPVYRFNFGRYERCVPSGACESDVDRP